MSQVQMLRLPALRQITGKCTSSIYNDVAAGRLTKGVRIGERSVAWPSYEIEAVLEARIRGADDAQIKALVSKMHAARTQGVDALAA